MKLVGIFQDLEHLYDFQTISYGGHFVFQNEAKIFQREVFIAINIPANLVKISSQMNEILRFMQKRDERTDGRTYGRCFIISRPQPSAADGR